MSSCQAKLGSERPRKKENKNFHSDQFQPRPGIENSKKITKKIQKIKKHHYGFFSSQNRMGKIEKERK